LNKIRSVVEVEIESVVECGGCRWEEESGDLSSCSRECESLAFELFSSRGFQSELRGTKDFDVGRC
jgi:hypothetical protein